MRKNEQVCAQESSCLLLINARSLNNKWLEIADHAANMNVSILALTETWCSPVTKDYYNVPGFVAFHACRHSQIGGGVALYVKAAYKPYLLDIPDYIGPCELLAVQMACNGMQWLVVYRPPSCSHEDSMAFFDYMDDFLTKYPRATVVGDFNIPELD